MPRLFWLALLPLWARGQATTTEEFIASPTLATVELYAGDTPLSYPVLYLGSPGTLTLAFDDLAAEPTTYELRILRCEADWQPSTLPQPQYLTGYSRVELTNYRPSQQTRVPYVHYEQAIPWQGLRITQSGNYLVQLSRSGQPGSPLLQLRFLVAEQVLVPSVEIRPSASATDVQTHHRVAVQVPSNRALVRDPVQELSLTLLQNFRWAPARARLKPTYVYPDRLEYDLVPEVEFPAGNEFRTADLRPIAGRGRGVAFRDCAGSGPCKVQLQPERTRAYARYLADTDYNGLFAIGLTATDRQLGAWEADYQEVSFELQFPDRLVGYAPVLLGAFNRWRPTPETTLQFDPTRRVYTTTVLLKQGVYNYQYGLLKLGITPVPPPDTTPFEGNYRETENSYTALVYYRPLGERFDRLLGIGWAANTR